MLGRLRTTELELLVIFLLSEQMAVNGRLVLAPYVGGSMEVSIYGAIMYEVRFTHLGHTLTYTPQNNEFQLQLSPKTFASKTYGLCGKKGFSLLLFCFIYLSVLSVYVCVGRFRASLQAQSGLCHCCLFVVAALGICDENGANDFTLRDGTVTTDWKRLIQEWTVQQPGYTCQSVPEEQCPVSDSSHCQVLLSASFAECHKVIAPATFHTICQQDSCHQERVCEVIASYAHLCRTSGVCVDWRTTDFCGECLHVPLNLGDKPSIGPLTLSGLQSLICLMKIKIPVFPIRNHHVRQMRL